ncbi:pleckstrin homology domain-containing family M member 1 [Spea bombifrons]|uniref:pleckstrin homology domain-containing family M member 1 n=1 Tax=Spea bombifrons TaxID=233779 RepID=UPI002349CEEE|nr:pleckstrin homology domain-containing family M member 1 [Spea bombifrons]
MYSSPAPENVQESRDVKLRITKKLSSCLRELQVRYVTTDDVVTSEDNDANGLCVALEAVFIHGLKPKFIKTEADRRKGRSRGRHVPLPQPAYWPLLKAITHRNVITELESVSFINTDVGRCRSWLRLALNDCLMECYFISLQREKSWLLEYYQPCALLLDAEDCDVVLSYLQGLSSLTFNLSYKSSILNVWTATPLSLSGLWAEDTERSILSPHAPLRRKSLDSVSQSSSSDDTNSSVLQEGKGIIESSSMSLETNSSSSQLSSSLGSDEQPHARAPVILGSPDISSCEVDSTEPEESEKSNAEDAEPSLPLASNATPTDDPPDELSEKETGLEAEDFKTQGLKSERQLSEPETLQSAVLLKPQSENEPASAEPPSHDTSNQNYSCDTSAGKAHATVPQTQAVEEPVGDSRSSNPEKSVLLKCEPCPVAELPKSRSWISEDDFQRPEPVIPTDQMQKGSFLPSQPLNQLIGDSTQFSDQISKSFNVVRRRQIGLSNPFRGLLMLGCLERRNALGLYKSFYCELTPYEFRLFLKGEEQICLENCSLFRCESVGPAYSDGRFELHFPAKKLYLRAPSEGEAQDWVERLQEAVEKFRPQKDEAWEVLQSPESPSDLENKTPSLGGSTQSAQEFSWVSPFEAEPDALKESILYMKIHKRWTQCIFSLSDRVLRCYLPKNPEKVLYSSYSIEMVRDILPDANLGSPSCFRLVTSKGSLQLQAESSLEAKAWRELVRAAYLESEEDSAFVPGDGKIEIKSHIREHPLFKYLLHIPTEMGLDSQNFKCAGCHKQIGFQFGKAKLCGFSGLYYCEWCHQDQGSVIPSRMVHNWDITERAVSKPALNFLNTVRNEPLMNVQYLNQRLYQHTQTMYEISHSRERLRLLGEYLVTCRSGALQELNKSLDQRTYLLDCAHTYSMRDLKQIADGAFEPMLQSVLEFASHHVYACELCRQRGFICLICNRNEIIYPFQFETTIRCGDCKAVFHRPCKTPRNPCPRCVRRKKYQVQGMKM